MKQEQDIIHELSSIKDMMQKSSRFISLSGLSGILAGVYALIGAYAAQLILQPFHYQETYWIDKDKIDIVSIKLFVIAASVIVAASSTGIFLSSRKAKKRGESIWDYQAKRLMFNFLIPLVTGGLFALTLIYHNAVDFVAPCTLLFYGLALIHASKYTLGTIRNFGYMQVLLGLLASIFIQNGILFMAIGFGMMHIVYGIYLYFKYDIKTNS